MSLKDYFKRFTHQATGNVAANKSKCKSKAVSGELFLKIERHFRESKPYLDSIISRKIIANDLMTNEKYIANAIREHSGMTFHEYINSQRLIYAHAMLSDPSCKAGITDIAISSGFSNRVSFYRCFVAKYGISPTELRKTVTK